MSGWPEIRLGSVAEFKNGLNFSRVNFGVGIKVLNVGDFKDHSTPIIESLTEINPEGLMKDSYLLQDGDIVFVRSNGNSELVGRSVLIKDVVCPITFSGFCIRARFVDPRASPEYYSFENSAKVV